MYVYAFVKRVNITIVLWIDSYKNCSDDKWLSNTSTLIIPSLTCWVSDVPHTHSYPEITSSYDLIVIKRSILA